MAAESICDGCGAREPMECYGGRWFKPSLWFERTSKETGETLTACSRNCINKIHEKRTAEGKESHTLVLPL